MSSAISPASYSGTHFPAPFYNFGANCNPLRGVYMLKEQATHISLFVTLFAQPSIHPVKRQSKAAE
jgi:hypothetical protein